MEHAFVQIDLNTVLTSLVAVGVVSTLRMLFLMRDQLLKLNGRVAVNEKWQESHEKSDDERHGEIIKAVEAIRVKR